MLSPIERNEAVNLLVMDQVTKLSSYYGSNIELQKMLTSGFKGYASFSDQELIKALSKIAHENYSVRSFLDNIIDDLILGSNR